MYEINNETTTAENRIAQSRVNIYIVSATVTEFSVQAMGGWKFVH